MHDQQSACAAFALVVGAPVLALRAAFLITSLVLLLTGDSVSGVWGQILSLPTDRGYINIINAATVDCCTRSRP